MTYEFIIQLTTADDNTTIHKCYYDNIDELYANYMEAYNDNEDFVIVGMVPCADINLSYQEIASRLETLGDDWEDKVIAVLDELTDNPKSEHARQVLHQLRITEDDLSAWVMVKY